VPPGFKVDLFAAEPDLANPVAFHIDERGRFYVVETFRLSTGVLDIRGRKGWPNSDFLKSAPTERRAGLSDELLDVDLASRLVDDRIAMLRKYMGTKVKDLTIESDRLRLIEDRDGDGKADQVTVFADGFSNIADGLGAGVLARIGDVYFANIPNLWLLRDTNNDGVADFRQSLHYGYGVRMGFLGHDLHGLRFGPDGKLYGVTGDLNRGRIGSPARIEQNTATTGSARVGGVFRINTDGSIPSDNPFINESDSDLHLWYSYGLRNSYGMAFDPLNGNLWYTENGPDKYDEIDRCPKGMNSGWLLIMGPDSRNATYSENNNTSYDATQLVNLAGSAYLDPEFSFKQPVGITAIQFLHSKRFPADLRDNVYVGDNNGGNIYYFKLKAARDEFVLKGTVADKVADNGTEVGKVLAGNGFSVITDMHVGADGYLYVTNLGTGKISRIRPVVDLLETNDFAVANGIVGAGGLEDLEESDDISMRLAPDPTSIHADTILASASFRLNELAPTSVTLDLESRCDGIVDQQILLHNVVTGAWDVLDDRRLTHLDRHHTLTLANPADYIRPSDKAIELRLVATAIDARTGSPGDTTLLGSPGGHTIPGTPTGAPSTGSKATLAKFHVWIDQLRMNVDYP
jgi:glucose/arabinose dehydrogenase